MQHFVYILYSQSTDHFYKGQTNDLSDRLMRHNLKQEKATKNGCPWVLIWSTEKPSRSEAMILEQKIKNLSRTRLIEFILKYSQGSMDPEGLSVLNILSNSIAGPDVPDKIVGKSGC